jgi:hypothetical protein
VRGKTFASGSSPQAIPENVFEAGQLTSAAPVDLMAGDR